MVPWSKNHPDGKNQDSEALQLQTHPVSLGAVALRCAHLPDDTLGHRYCYKERVRTQWTLHWHWVFHYTRRKSDIKLCTPIPKSLGIHPWVFWNWFQIYQLGSDWDSYANWRVGSILTNLKLEKPSADYRSATWNLILYTPLQGSGQQRKMFKSGWSIGR